MTLRRYICIKLHVGYTLRIIDMSQCASSIVKMLARTIIFMATVGCCAGGTDFAMGFMEGPTFGGAPVGMIYVTNPGEVTATVSVDTPRIAAGSGALFSSLTVPPGGDASLSLDDTFQMSGSGIENIGIRVTSDQPVTVEALNAGAYDVDGFRVPPVSQLGRVYVAVTYKFLDSTSYQGPFDIGIVAPYDATDIAIDLHGPQALSVIFVGVTYVTGDLIVFTLDSFQTAQFQFAYRDGGDFSGTTIVASKQILVMSGAQSSSVGTYSYTGHLVTVLPPVEQLGRKYVIQPVEGRSTGDVVSVVGLCPDTTYSITEADGTSIGVVDRTLMRCQSDIHILGSGVSHVLEASCPVLVAQFAMSVGEESHQNSDPFLMALPPADTPLSSSYAFSTMDSPRGEFTNTLALAVPTAARDEVLLDGAPFTPTWTQIGELSATQMTVAVGAHTLEHPGNVRFAAWLYGQRYKESYALDLSPSPETYTFTPWATSIDDVGHDLTTLLPATTIDDVGPDVTTFLPATTIDDAGRDVTTLIPATTIDDVGRYVTTLLTTTSIDDVGLDITTLLPTTSIDNVGHDVTTLLPATTIDDVGRYVTSLLPATSEAATYGGEETDKYMRSVSDRAVSDPASRRTCLGALELVQCATACTERGDSVCRGFEYRRIPTGCCLLGGVSYTMVPEVGTSVWSRC